MLGFTGSGGLTPKLFALIAVATNTSFCATAPDFSKEYGSFYADAHRRGCAALPVEVTFDDLPDGTAGLCFREIWIVVLDKPLWEKYGPHQRLELMYHELGHCSLYLDHADKGLMSPTIHREAELVKNWQEWENLLFKDCQKWSGAPNDP